MQKLRFGKKTSKGMTFYLYFLEAKQLRNKSWLTSNLMHKFLIYLYIIHLLKSSTCFDHYPAHLQEVYVVTVYMQPLV